MDSAGAAWRRWRSRSCLSFRRPRLRSLRFLRVQRFPISAVSRCGQWFEGVGRGYRCNGGRQRSGSRAAPVARYATARGRENQGSVRTLTL